MKPAGFDAEHLRHARTLPDAPGAIALVARLLDRHV